MVSVQRSSLELSSLTPHVCKWLLGYSPSPSLHAPQHQLTYFGVKALHRDAERYWLTYPDVRPGDSLSVPV